MFTKKYVWHKIADSVQALPFNRNGLAEVEVNGKIICIALHKEIVMACARKCPHAGGIMAQGYVDDTGNIVCPLHRYKFSLQNGRNVSGEGYYLKTYLTEIRENGVFVRLEEGGLF